MIPSASRRRDMATERTMSSAPFPHSPAPPLPGGPLREVELPVEGMSCASCVGHVDEALRDVPGVVAVSVNLVANVARVRFDPEATEKARLVSAVREAGYDVPPEFEARAETKSSKTTSADDSDQRGAREVAGLRRDLLWSSVFTIPLVGIAMSHGALLGGGLGASVQFALATLTLVGPGRRFFVAAARRAARGRTDMNTLIALGSGAAYLYSSVGLLRPGLFSHGHHSEPNLYFEAAGAIITFLLLGKFLEAKTKRHLGDAVRALLARKPRRASRVLVRSESEDRSEFSVEREEVVETDELEIGDLVLVRPGENPATDGVVAYGAAAVDESMLTGESVPVEKGPGARVFGGTTNHRGAFVLRIEKVGSETVLAKIAEAVRIAQSTRAPIADLADRVSAVFVPAVLAIAALTFVVGWWSGDDGAPIARAFESALAVLVIACPCALGLATPAAIAASTGRGAELGILASGGAALEAMSRIDLVGFDKTGTLTLGRPTFVGAESFVPGVAENHLLALSAAVEARSEHPIARALTAAATERALVMPEVTNFASAVGQGVSARVEGRAIRLGQLAYVTEARGENFEEFELRARAREARGESVFYLSEEGRVTGLVAVADTARPEAAGVVRALERAGLRVVVLSGDRPATASALAAQLGIADCRGGLLPEDKVRFIEEARRRGRVVAMVGDGINDAPALAAADVGIALGTGADVALGAADVALLAGGLSRVPTALALGRRTVATIRQNLFWAFAYNLVGIPLAAGVFRSFGVGLSPLFASAAMSLSSVSVLLNSLRLRNAKLDDSRHGEDATEGSFPVSRKVSER